MVYDIIVYSVVRFDTDYIKIIEQIGKIRYQQTYWYDFITVVWVKELM